MGLDVPQVTRVISARCRQMGLDVDAGVYTVEQAVAGAAALQKEGDAMLKDITLGQYFPGKIRHPPTRPADKAARAVIVLYRGAVSGQRRCVSYGWCWSFSSPCIRISRVHLKMHPAGA